VTVGVCVCGLQVTVDVHGCTVGYHHFSDRGVDWVFVDHPSYPRPGGIYGDEHGTYGDNQVSHSLLAAG
jgi:starch synthase